MAVSEEKNAEYFRELLEKTARFDMAFAVENMCDITIAPKRKFGAYPEELVNLAKRVGDSPGLESAGILNMGTSCSRIREMH